jgi:transposase
MKDKIEMQIKNPNACGIDIGSRSHFVAVGQSKEDVREFGVSHSEHLKLIDFLIQNEVKTVAMESTGSYWQSLFLVLTQAGFETLLVSGAQTKGFRKTDVKDARQLQQLHSLGMLSSCFLPDEFTGKIRELCRHRKSLIKDCSKYSNRIQKCLRLMNLRLDVVISDINGVTGSKIISAILDGERDPMQLASLSDKRIRKTKEEIADALVGNFKDELLYELRDVNEIYCKIQEKIKLLDGKTEEVLIASTKQIELPKEVSLAKKQLKGKNQPKIKIQELCYKLYGTDLSAIPGLGPNTLLSIVTELGTAVGKFRNSKSFVSWLRLAPNNKISGGKVLSSHTPKGANPLTIALRDASNVIGNQKSGELSHFFKRIGLKKGRSAAITATARKMATIIFKMIKDKVPYEPSIPSYILEKIAEKKLRNLKRMAMEHGFLLIDNQGVALS